MQSTRLRVIGGLYEADADTIVASDLSQVTRAFEAARSAGKQLTVAGSKRSFGLQFLPPRGHYLLDVGALDRGATIRERNADGSIWVVAGGGTRFKDLHDIFPAHRAHCPPTSDAISLAGALAACTHSAAGYFADSVRAFRLVCPNGHSYACRKDAPGLEGQLFLHAVGSFGALGVITEMELRLDAIDPTQQVLVHSLFAGRSDSGAYLSYLEAASDDPRFSEGTGAAVYGNRGHAIVFGEELLPAGDLRTGPQALLTDDAVQQHAITQALVNRWPRLAEWLVSRAYAQGAARWAPWYGFQFFQRGYDAAHALMAEDSALAQLLRLLGARYRMPMCHTSWFFPRAELRAMMDGYFRILDDFPGLEKTVEQQDLVLLGPSQWPCHTLGRTDEPIGVLTSSFAVDRDRPSQARCEEFFRRVTEECRSFAPGARVSLCKQIHASPHVVRDMHGDFISRIQPLKAQVDPEGLLTSRFLADLGLA